MKCIIYMKIYNKYIKYIIYMKNYYICLRFGLTMSTKRHCGPKLNIKRKIIREGHNR